MAKRTKQKQSIHDAKVKNLANQLKRKGYNVKADLTGFEKPSPISDTDYELNLSPSALRRRSTSGNIK